MRNLKCRAIIRFLVLFLLPFTLISAQSEGTSDIFEKYKQSVVSLVSLAEDKTVISKGTGFMVGDEVLATAYHLVSQAKSVEGLDFKGKKVKIESLLNFDKNLDLAFLKAKGKGPALAFGSSDELGAGNKLIAIGSKESGELGFFEAAVKDFLEYAPGRRIVDVDLPAPDSFCGSPALDSQGRVMGLVVYLDIRNRFLLPANMIKDLKKTGSETKFKDWQAEDYFSTPEGAEFAGKVYYALDDTGKAEKYLKEVIKQKPEDVESQVKLATVYFKQRNYSSAVESYQKIIELEPNRDTAHLGLGIVYLRMMRYKEAIAPLEKAVELNLDNKEAYFHAGNAYEELREFENAAEAYKKYLDTKPQNSHEVFQRLGLCYLELEQFENAVSALQEALKATPQDIQMNFKLALAYQKAGQYENAEKTYMLLAQLTPEDAKVYYNNIIMMYDSAQMPDRAIQAAQKLVELDPRNTDALYNLGYMFIKLERWAEAIENFKKVLEIRPDMEYAYLQIGYCYSQLNKFRDLVEVSKKFVQAFPENTDGWQNIGIGYMQMKKFAEAVEPLKKTIELKPDNATAYYNLGICYLNLKDKTSAVEIYKKLNTLDPELAKRFYKFLAR